MRYWTRSALGIAVYVASVLTFNLKLVALLSTGTCASGNQPFVISQPCPAGTELDAILLTVSIFGLFISAGLYMARGEPPRGRRLSDFAWPLAWWGIFFGVTGAVALIHSLTADVPADAELGGIIVGITFLVMGVPALVFLAMGVGGGFRTRETRKFAQVGDPIASARAAFARDPGQRADRSRDETISKLERLQRLRESGALSDAEFEREKARVLGGG